MFCSSRGDQEKEVSTGTNLSTGYQANKEVEGEEAEDEDLSVTT